MSVVLHVKFLLFKIVIRIKWSNEDEHDKLTVGSIIRFPGIDDRDSICFCGGKCHEGTPEICVERSGVKINVCTKMYLS